MTLFTSSPSKVAHVLTKSRAWHQPYLLLTAISTKHNILGKPTGQTPNLQLTKNDSNIFQHLVYERRLFLQVQENVLRHSIVVKP